MLRDVDLVGHDGAVQALVEEQVGSAGNSRHSVKVPGGAVGFASTSSWT